MKFKQQVFSNDTGWVVLRDDGSLPEEYQLVLAFGDTELIKNEDLYPFLRQEFPNASLLMASGAGEIAGSTVSEGRISLVALQLQKSQIKTAEVITGKGLDCFRAGEILARSLDTGGLKYVLVISDGHSINGTDLVDGLRKTLPPDVLITGGLAGDGTRFTTTVVGINETPFPGRIAAIGFYGDSLRVKSGTMGGWEPFGPDREVTRSEGNIVYEIDGEPALSIYRKHLGDYAKELPGAALLFPLSVKTGPDGDEVVRTILSVNEENDSLTFAGAVAQGSTARLMKTSIDQLVTGAHQAALQTDPQENSQAPDLALLISCVGRKMILGQRVEEEIEAISRHYGDTTVVTGFYSYGEIAPGAGFTPCRLHNQTMTITTISER